MAVLLAKLENMPHNSLYVNILLTGIVGRLACYPQPLLRSFLLNTNMVFQPSVKSLIQVSPVAALLTSSPASGRTEVSPGGRAWRSLGSTSGTNVWWRQGSLILVWRILWTILKKVFYSKIF